MFKRLSIDTVRRTITLIDSDSGQENQPLELNRSEYNLLLAFCESHGEVIDKQVLIEKGWPGRVVGENSLAVAIMKLRKKLDSLELGFEVNNLPGEGYVFINAMGIDIVHEELVSKSDSSPESQHVLVDDVQSPENQISATDGEVEAPELIQEQPSQSMFEALSRWGRKPVVWEVTIALFIGLLMFYFVYREAFECFECFGGGVSG